MKKAVTTSLKKDANYLKEYFKIVGPKHIPSTPFIEWNKEGDLFKKLSFYDESNLTIATGDSTVITGSII